MSERLLQKILSDVTRWKSTPEISDFVVEHLMFRDDDYVPLTTRGLARLESDGSWHVLRAPKTADELAVYAGTLLEAATGMNLTATEESMYFDDEKLGRKRTDRLLRILWAFADDAVRAINDSLSARRY